MKKYIKKLYQIKNMKEKVVIAVLWKVLLVLSFPIVLNMLELSNDDPVDNNEQGTIEKKNIEEPTFVANFSNLSYIQNLNDIMAHIFYVDQTAYVTIDDFPIQYLAELDLAINLRGNLPRVLITHTHANEYFIDSEEGNVEHSIVGVGRYLANILSGVHGVSVVHDVGVYDMKDGEIHRTGSYELVEQGIRHILELHPTIDVIIDLHRDAAPEGVHLVTYLDDKPTAKIMFFNGITRRNIDGAPHELYHLFNPYLQENLALSLQMFLTANERYEGLARKNYIKAYRYSLHILPRSMLVEVGANTNTVQEAKNAMYPLANIIMEVLQEK